MGERVNGIHEVRGSIPLASMSAGGALLAGEANPVRAVAAPLSRH